MPKYEFIKADKDLEAEGFHAATYDIGIMNGKVYALPFAGSLPILYLNVDLVTKAGGDPANPPKTWDVAFRSLIGRHQGKVRHIFFGHCHMPLAGSTAGLPTTSLRDTNHASVAVFSETTLLSASDLPEAYGVVFIKPDYVTVHMIEFGYSGPVRIVIHQRSFLYGGPSFWLDDKAAQEWLV